jgi:uncharacterized protein (DUF1697 family)
MRYVAFLRGVNLGKRTVRSAELRAAIEDLGFTDVRTLLASGNVLFEARPSKGLKQKLELGLEEAFGFKIGVVLRSIDELKAMVAADPFGGVLESEAAKLHVVLFAEPVPEGVTLKPVAGDFDLLPFGPREIFIIAYRKPDGTYLAGGLLDLEKTIPKAALRTARNWNTILKAIA